MSKGGKAKTVQTEQNTAPWAGQQGYLNDIFGRAAVQASAPRVAPQSAYTTQAIDARANEATDPNSLTGQAKAQIGSTISGDYLGSNPYLDASVNRALGMTKASVNSNFQGDNFGNSAHQEWLTNKLSDTAFPYYMNAYESERGRQLEASRSAPALSELSLGQLEKAGGMQDTYAQRQTDAPWDAIMRYQAAVAGPYGGATSGTQPYYGGGGLNDMLGLGLLAYGAFK